MSADQPGTLRDERPPVVAALAAAGFESAREVGRGGFGVVYRCSQEGLDRVVAVKVLTATLSDDRARFVREQQAMGRLTGHPNIVSVLQVGELESGVPFLVMPFCRKGCLQERIARFGVLPVEKVLRIGVKLAGALTAAHRLGVVHRDVKPANILLTDYGEPALTDFGIARIDGGLETGTGLFAGSPAFLAPEAISGAPPSPASDVYGLGATLFAAFTGHAAFERHTGEQVVAQFLRITTEPVPDLRERGMPEDVAAVISAAMARDPGQRPSALELGQHLQQVQASHGLPVDEMALDDPKVCQRRGAASAAPAGTLPGSAARGNLPAPLSGLVGRGAEMARLAKLVVFSRLVTVTGVGGIGKTTLATHAARSFRPEFSDGIWLIELAELRDGSLLVKAMAGALGLRDQPGQTLPQLLVGFLEPRRVLLVLDNCEHLIDDVAKLAETLLRDCPQLHILATSREILDIGGEAVLALTPLAVPDPGDIRTLESLAACEAVALFVERARAALPDFVLTVANAREVARICARLEGLPLALELAAARSRMLPLEQIAEGISDRFSLLTRGRRGAPARQHTLAGCIDWSFRLCTATEQHLWTQLTVFTGTFDLPAVQHMTAAELCRADCLDLVSALVDKSIITPAHQHQTDRYKLLDTLRDYGRTRLADTDFDQLRRRHAAYYQQVLAQARAEWFSDRQIYWLGRIEAEMPNIREALRFSVTDSPPAALQMAIDVRPMWQLRGMFSEGRQWLEMALSATTPEPTPLRVLGITYAIAFPIMQGDLTVARKRITEGRTMVEGLDDSDLHSQIELAGGFLAMHSGEFERARAHYRSALDITNDYEVRAVSTLYMGITLEYLGRYDEAVRWYEMAVALAQTQGDPYLQACTQNLLGLVLWRLGELQRADQQLKAALNTFSRLNERWFSAYCLEGLAWIAGSRHDPRRAAVLMAAACAVSGAAGTQLLPFPDMPAWHDQCHRQARAELDAAEFQTAWAEGNALSLCQAASFAAKGTAIPGPT